MKNKNHKKSLAFGIILIFIGASFLPITSGNTDKTAIKSIKKDFLSNDFRDSYVDAYWKFDDCTGSTLTDSSGHDYHGTIYGATWTIFGHDSCALDFDGVDDYVDFDAYSEGLGFNKTDDL